MVDILNPDLEKYLLDTFDHDDAVIKELEVIGKERDFPIIGPLVGRTIMQLSRLLEFKEKRIFELGSGFGYSAHWFAKGSGDETIIHCTDFDGSNKELAMKYFEKAGIRDRIQFHIGDGLEILASMDNEIKFDIIFCDIEKEDYPRALDIAVSRVRRGGLILFDNTLWSGRILDDNPDEASKGVLAFNRKIATSSELISSIIPIRDGLSFSIRV